MKVEEMKQELPIPEGVEVTVQDSSVTVKGPKGELNRAFRDPKIKLSVAEGKVIMIAKNATKRQKTMMGTIKAHFNNMMKGVVEPHVYKLKICSGHFPMTVTVKDNQLEVKNFFGERTPRTLTLVEGATAKVEGDLIIVESLDIEKAGQCAGGIEQLTRVTNRDRRVFMDGLWIVHKAGKDL